MRQRDLLASELGMAPLLFDTCVDHRGKRVALQPSENASTRAKRADRKARVTVWIRGDAYEDGIFAGAFWYVLLACLGLLLGVLVTPPNHWPEVIACTVFACAVLLVWRYFYARVGPGRAEHERKMSRIVWRWLARECCPGCGRTLAGLAREADGCVVCPECGAAWNGYGLSAEHPFWSPPETITADKDGDRPIIFDERGWKYSFGMSMKKEKVSQLAWGAGKDRPAGPASGCDGQCAARVGGGADPAAEPDRGPGQLVSRDLYGDDCTRIQVWTAVGHGQISRARRARGL